MPYEKESSPRKCMRFRFWSNSCIDFGFLKLFLCSQCHDSKILPVTEVRGSNFITYKITPLFAVMWQTYSPVPNTSIISLLSCGSSFTFDHCLPTAHSIALLYVIGLSTYSLLLTYAKRSSTLLRHYCLLLRLLRIVNGEGDGRFGDARTQVTPGVCRSKTASNSKMVQVLQGRNG